MMIAQHAADEKAILDLDKQWGDAATRLDLEATVAFYAPDGALVWPDAPAVHGTTGIRAAWKDMIDNTPGLTLQFVADKITISDAGDIGVDFGAVHFGYTGPDGAKINLVGKYVVVWHKLSGEWKVLYDSWNYNAKQPAT